MSIWDLFRRKPQKELVFCKSPQLKEFINRWTKDEGWGFEDFGTILSLIGIPSPVWLEKYDEDHDSFWVVKCNGYALKIRLRFTDRIDTCTEITKMDSGITEVYSINRKEKKFLFFKNKLKVSLDIKVIERDEKKLTSFFGPYFCNRKLKFFDGRILDIYIDVPEMYQNNREEAIEKSRQNHNEIEKYLISLPNDFDFDSVYEHVMRLLGYTDEELSSCETIKFCLHQGNENGALGKFELSYGVLSENGE